MHDPPSSGCRYVGQVADRSDAATPASDTPSGPSTSSSRISRRLCTTRCRRTGPKRARPGRGARQHHPSASPSSDWCDESTARDSSVLTWPPSPPSPRASRWASRRVGTTGASGARTGSPARCWRSRWTGRTPVDPIVVARSTSFPFCFDWQADGTMLITGAHGLQRLEPDGQLVAHADLTDHSAYGWNEVAVHPSGRTYVNGINFDMMGADGMNFELGSKTRARGRGRGRWCATCRGRHRCLPERHGDHARRRHSSRRRVLRVAGGCLQHR